MIFIYNRDEKQIAHLDIVPKITEEIGKLRVLEFESELEFEKGFRIVADIEDKKAEFIIIDIDYDRDDTKQFSYFCQDSFIEMQSVPILDKRPTGNIESAMTPIFDNTRWIFEIRSTDTINQNYNNSFYHINALEAFAETVEKYKVEWITEFKYVGSKITERRVVIYRRDGRSKGRLEFGKNIKKFSRKILSEPIITALYPYGKGEDLGNGSYGRRMGIESVNNGIPYIENKQATELYGIGEKGSKKPLFAFITFEEETDPSNLKKEAQKELDILSQIRAEHIVEAIDLDIDAKIGYEVAAIDDEISYRGYSRIIKLVRQGDDVEVTFGQVTKAFTDTFQKTLKKTEQGLIEVFEQVNIIRTSANGKTDVFTGPTKPVNANEGDIWYRYNADGTVDLLNFVNGEWVDELSEKVFKELKGAIEANTQLVNDAKLAADAAVAETEQIKANIEDLVDLSTALTQLDDAQTRITDMETQISEAIGNITADFYGNAPQPPYELHQKWYKTEYTPSLESDTGYESIKDTDNVTLDEFSNAGLFICINPKQEGEVFDWNDWKRIATDNTSLLQQIEEGYTYDIQQLEKGYRETLLDYAKSTDLNGLATEEYALTVSQTEAGKVSTALESYKKTNDSVTSDLNTRVSTTEGNYTTLTRKVDGEVQKLFDVTQTVEGQTTVIKDLTGETGNMSLVEIRQNINEFSSKFVNMPDNITGTVNLDSAGVPIAPYKKGNIWYKDDYNFTQGYDTIITTDNVTLDEFANKGIWVAIKDSANGVFNWNDWQRVSADSSFQLSEIYQDIEKIALTVQNNDNNTKSQLLQLSNMIDMTVTKDDLIGQINTQAGNVLIRATGDGKTSVLNVTKDGTYIETGLIETAHIGNEVVTNSKIGKLAVGTTNIQDASITNAKILSLDVYKISGNVSEFVKSHWNAINSSVTIDGNGMYIDGDWGGAIRFTRRGQTFYDKIKGQVMGYQYGLYRNDDDPLVNSQMLGVFLGSEMGYDLRLGVRKQIDNQNNTYMAIKSAGGTATRAEVYGATTFLNGINMNGTAITNASNAGYEIITNSNGMCMKFNNGFKIQWKRMDYIVRSTGFEGWGYPVAFSSVPIAYGNAARDDVMASNANIAFSNVNSTACNVRISDKENAYTIFVMAIGF